jgi:hypothetical protein
MKSGMRRLDMRAPGYVPVLKLGRTIADLDGSNAF